ncbi:MAG: protoheme IX farnesyltransferase [Verrucomicrobia bacterium]|nr:protoheme IX farnesyltransferase [Verrucomicrobiota bacterium]
MKTALSIGLSEEAQPAESAPMSDGLPSESRRAESPSLAADVMDLVKLRLSLLVVFTTWLGFYLGWQGPMNWLLMFHTVFGTVLAACGAGALNQYLEREHDARMRRTRERPLPSSRLTPDTALIIGVALSIAGLLELAAFASLLAAVLAAATIVTYLFCYTPLKRRTSLNTLVGAIPGAIPPLIGWAVATDGINFGGWLLFMLMFAWQMPHFLAIAWMYRDDYAQAGFVMLPGNDADGSSTGRQAVNYTLITWVLGMAPAMFGLTAPWHAVSALLLGAWFALAAFRFHLEPVQARARTLFLVSIVYLPLLLASLAIFKRG